MPFALEKVPPSYTAAAQNLMNDLNVGPQTWETRRKTVNKIAQ